MFGCGEFCICLAEGWVFFSDFVSVNVQVSPVL